MTTTPPRINPRLGAAALRAPAASKEDSRPQAILKFDHPSTLDYRACHGLPHLHCVLSSLEFSSATFVTS